MIGYYNQKNTHYLYDATAIDSSGNLFVLFVNSPGEILKFNTQLEIIEKIDISESTKLNLFSNKPAQLCSGWIGAIYFSSKSEIILGTHDDQIIVLNMKGEFINSYPMQTNQCHLPIEKPRFARNFYTLSNGKVVLLTYKNGSNIISVSSDTNPKFTVPFKSIYLNDTFYFQHDERFDTLDFLEVNKTFNNQTIGYLLHAFRSNYIHKESEPYIHHSTELSINQVLELQSKKLLLKVMTNPRNKSNTPNKNMPYYFFLVNSENGKILTYISPKDKSVYKDNFQGKIIKLDDNIILFKTFENLYLMNNDLNVIETISLMERSLSAVRNFSILGKHNNTIYLSNNWKGEIVSFQLNTNDLYSSFKNLCKEIKLAKKNKSDT